MKKTFLIVLLLLSCVFIFAQLNPWLWATKAGGTTYDEGYGIAVDTSGNSYVTGFFEGTATFGSITLTSSGYSRDIFIAKLDSSGNWLWARKAGGTYWDYGYGIAVDVSGNNYVMGCFKNMATFGSATLTSYGDWDIFIAKLDSNGNWLWVTKAGGTGDDWGYGIAVDSSGNNYVTGWFGGSATFGSTILTSNGGADIFVAKLDSSGNWLWAKNAGGIDCDEGQSIAVDANGNSYVTGYFSDSATFGSTTLTSSGGADIFVAKLDSSGNWLWAKNAGGTDYDCGNSIAVDASGNIYVTGGFEGTATFGSTTLTSNGDSDIFIAKLDSSGNWLGATKTGGTDTVVSYGIAVDASGNNYVTGFFYRTATFGPTTLTSSGSADIFVAKVHIPYYPEGVSIVEETYGIPVTVYGGDADRGTLDNFPPVPGQSATYKKFNFILDNGIPNWTITMQTSDTYGAYYQNNSWNVVNGNGTEIVFNINFSGSKEATEIPIILSLLVAELQPIYPNPFNQIAYIPYTLEIKSEVKINIYNTRGQVVNNFDLGSQEKGHYIITWDGRDNDGNLCGNGIYYIVMKAGKERFQRKAVLMKQNRYQVS